MEQHSNEYVKVPHTTPMKLLCLTLSGRSQTPWKVVNRHGPEEPWGPWQSSTPDTRACCLSLHEGHPVTAWEAAYLVRHLLLREEVTKLSPSKPKRPVERF